jgi:hypothetical protein
MLTSYEEHLYEVLGKTQEKLKNEVDNCNYLKSKNKELELEQSKYRDYWLESSSKADKLEKELKAVQEKEEQAVTATYPSAKVMTSDKTILDSSTSVVKEAV